MEVKPERRQLHLAVMAGTTHERLHTFDLHTRCTALGVHWLAFSLRDAAQLSAPAGFYQPHHTCNCPNTSVAVKKKKKTLSSEVVLGPFSEQQVFSRLSVFYAAHPALHHQFLCVCKVEGRERT